LLRRLGIAAFLLAIILGTSSTSSAQVPQQTLLINEMIAKKWDEVDVKPSRKTNDYEFLRRVFIDVIGRIPSADEVRDFELDKSPTKRSKVIARLLRETKYSPKDPRTGKAVPSYSDPKKPLQLDYTAEYAAHWSNIWTVWLMTRGGVHPMYHEQMKLWLEEEFSKNTPHDQFVRTLLTATGETNKNGAVNFIVAHLGDPTPGDKKISDGPWEAVPITSRVTRLFLGIQVQCTQCHDHPFNPEWKQVNFWGVNAFFRQTDRDRMPTPAMGGQNKKVKDGVQVKLTDEKSLNPAQAVFFEKRNGQVEMTNPVFLADLVDLEAEKPSKGPKLMPKGAEKSRRELLADFVVNHDNFSRAYVNRVWAHFFGRGMNEQPVADDFGGHNKVVHQELINKLADEFARYKYDTKQLIEWIVNSDAYQLASVVNGLKDDAGGNTKPETEPFFARMQLKAMSPEVLFESLMEATKSETTPDAEEKKATREVWMAKLVRNFGDDEGNEITFSGTIVQALLMMNGRELNAEVSRRGNSSVEKAIKRYGVIDKNGRLMSLKEAEVLDDLYLSALGRHPSDNQTIRYEVVNEKTKAKTVINMSEKQFVTAELKKLKATAEYTKDPFAAYRAFYEDIFWALLNTNEFILNH
jgi:hypothetical protein